MSPERRADLEYVAGIINDRDDIIRRALADWDATIADIRDIFGLTRQRVYQIRDAEPATPVKHRTR